MILEEAANMPQIGVAYETQAYTQEEYEEALWAAVSNRQIGVVKLLLAAQPRLPLRSETTLLPAVVIGSTEIAQMLIENGAAVTPYSSEYRVPLHHAADRVSIEPEKLLAYSCVEAETGNQSPSPYERDFQRHTTPLFFAASADHRALVGELLNAGADPREDLSMLYAVREPSIIARLLAANAKLHPNSENTLLDMPFENGDTILGLAAGRADVSWVKELLRFGAKPAARNSNGMTPREITNGIGYLRGAADVGKVLAEAEEEEYYYGHRNPIVHTGYKC